MKITLKNMEFFGKDERQKQYDLCLHGDISLEVNGRVVTNEEARTLSASALRFLRAAFGNHFYGAEEHMIPCCGHEMYASEDGKTVHIFGCPFGFDFDVLHENGELIFRFENGDTELVSFAEYRSAVLAFAVEIEAFYQKSSPREAGDELEHDGLSAFWHEFLFLKEQLKNTLIDQTEFCLRFDDYRAIEAGRIINTTRLGINLGGFDFVHFRECAYNYKTIYGGEENCVGEYDLSGSMPSIAFYTAPLTTHVFFEDEKKMNDVQKEIEDYGFLIKEEQI